MNKKISLIILLVISYNQKSLSASLNKSTRRITTNRTKSKPFPINIEWKNQMSSNINFQPNASEKNIYATGFKIGSKLKKKIKRGTYLIDLPSADILIAPESSHHLREYNISNTLIGLYISSKKHIFTFSSSQNIGQSLSLNGDNQIQKNRSTNISLDIGHGYSPTAYFKLDTTIGTKLKDYQTRADVKSVLDEENDDWKQFVKLKMRVIPHKKLNYGLITYADQKLNKEKRALKAIGGIGGDAAETTRQYRVGPYINFKIPYSTFDFKVLSVFNDDRIHGAKDYKGINYEASSKFNIDQLTYVLKAQYKTQDYSVQRENTELSPEASPLYKTKSYSISNKLILPTNWIQQYNIEMEHKFQTLSTNRSDEGFRNHLLQVALKFKY